MRLLLVLVQRVGEGNCRHFVALEEEIEKNKQWEFGESPMIKSRFDDEKIEEGNIEYGNIENCNIKFDAK